MVSFGKDKFIVEIYTGDNPVEAWIETHKELLMLLQSINSDYLNGIESRRILNLLEEMMPDLITAEKMTVE